MTVGIWANLLFFNQNYGCLWLGLQ